jgi:hypothetical protein
MVLVNSLINEISYDVYLRKLSVAQNIRPRMLLWVANSETEGMWKEAVVAWFQGPSEYLPVTLKTSVNTLSQDSYCLGRGSKRVPYEY